MELLNRLSKMIKLKNIKKFGRVEEILISNDKNYFKITLNSAVLVSQ